MGRRLSWGERTLAFHWGMCEAAYMNTFIPFVIGGALLLFVGRSTIKPWTLGANEMSVGDKRAAIAIVAALLASFVALVLILRSSG